MARVGIHIFRKDLRVQDNLALNELASKVDSVVGIFIFDPKQIKRSQSNSSHYSDRSAQFIIDCVEDLKKQCNNKLIVAYGNPLKVIQSVVETTKPIALSFNSDFTPYSIQRDNGIISMCKKFNVETIINEHDQLHVATDLLLKKDKSPYMVFGSFYKNLKKHATPKPTTKSVKWFSPRLSLDTLDWSPIGTYLIGGRTQALSMMKKIKIRPDSDYLSNESSRLSAYLNFGCISMRELHHHIKQKYGTKPKMLESIAWRDFFTCIYRFAPSGNEYEHIDQRYNKLKWPKIKETEWKRFVKCDTGFLLIDAIMTELLQTGYINNRARLLLSTFWIKYLIIDPFNKEYGSQTGFSRLLIDCSASQNKLNHQWVIGDLDFAGRRFGMKGTHSLTGRMIRIDNDMIKRYDPNYEYIAKWLPRFANMDLKERKKVMKQVRPMYDWKKRYLEYAKLFNSLS